MKNKLVAILSLVVVVVGVIILYKALGIDIIPAKEKASQEQVRNGDPLDSAEGYGVSAGHPLAVKVGMDVLEKGGNAVDAAVAVSYALTVVEPYASGIGGGGEMLIDPGNGGKPVAYEYRDVAPPSNATLQSDIGIPGFVKGMETIHADFGSQKLADLIAPSIELAETGFEVNSHLTTRLGEDTFRMTIDEVPHFFPNGNPLTEGETLKQEELAETLRTIQKEGSDAFYKGKIAQHIIERVPNLAQSDFSNYKVEKRKPLIGKYQGFDVIAAPPPVAGATVIQALRMAEMHKVGETEKNSADFVHLISEVSKIANADRLKRVADPAFYNEPKQLASKDYARRLAKKVSPDTPSAGSGYNDSKADEEDYDNTTHFVVVDKKGMMVSATNTIANFFGSGIYVDGFFLNNQLTNFSKSDKPPNHYQPGKLPRSYTAPVILKNDEMLIGMGTPGGKRIPMMMAEVLIRHLTFGESIDEAIHQPRFYAEGETLYVESGFSEETVAELGERGYTVILKDSPHYYGGMQALVVDKKKDKLYGGADTRRGGSWDVGK
ncbi:gamma-glutamyltransferase [Numidum massiliense]|uniref:gamma-glutamyltransferase n=1 Tax=Numidum massiliense TaxID=1522315 RepID=UPI0006D59C10|nr:gamma-glutamyltransferase [Numidum massiliense]